MGDLTLTLDTPFCLSALEQDLELSTPEIFSTDHGSQVTRREVARWLEKEEIRISMDSGGQLYDNISVGRFWRSIKYEEVPFRHYQAVSEARNGVAPYVP